jgi:hypothetical protein
MAANHLEHFKWFKKQNRFVHRDALRRILDRNVATGDDALPMGFPFETANDDSSSGTEMVDEGVGTLLLKVTRRNPQRDSPSKYKSSSELGSCSAPAKHSLEEYDDNSSSSKKVRTMSKTPAKPPVPNQKGKSSQTLSAGMVEMATILAAGMQKKDTSDSPIIVIKEIMGFVRTGKLERDKQKAALMLFKDDQYNIHIYEALITDDEKLEWIKEMTS